jgi:hypothetical protein
VNNVVRGCHALQHLSLTSCGLCPKTVLQAMDDEPRRLPMLTIDAPQSRLQALVCEFCYIGGVGLVQAPKLAKLWYNAELLLQDSMAAHRPISFGCAPSLRRLWLCQEQVEHSFVKHKLSELLVDSKLDRLCLTFTNGKVREYVLHAKLKHKYFSHTSQYLRCLIFCCYSGTMQFCHCLVIEKK